jgi:redox-sensitive bicupin YhaK (pirin superfamily)
VNGKNAHADHFVLLKNDGENFTIEATDGSVILILSGEPINEPIVAYGPFVMNTWEEIENAVQDVNAGKFGILED